MHDGDVSSSGPIDSWNILPGNVSSGFGYGDVSFLILGTSAGDEAAKPHVLSPPLMESLRQFLPFALSENNFWLKFSMARDGQSIYTLLQNIRGSKNTIVAVETVNGDVFGFFTGTSWRRSLSFFGNGESFLWRMRGNREKLCQSAVDQARLESDLEVFPWTGENNMVQACTNDRLAIGGGVVKHDASEPKLKDNERDTGFGLALEADLLRGTSFPCATFGNPGLSRMGTCFDVLNVEVWTLTPFMTIEEAHRMEMTLLFLENKVGH